MILTNYVIYRGRKLPVNELSPTSGYKVRVRCPECEKEREVYYRSVAQAGHCLCRACANRKKNRRYLPIGYQNNRLTVIGHAEKSGYSICKCDCGNIKTIDNNQIKSGGTKSCGCLLKEHLQKIKDASPKGEGHWNWQGGIAPERAALMASAAYKQWREKVFVRDKYTCQKCLQVGYILNAHHVEPFHADKLKRLDISNGITFCNKCHNNFHKIYGRKSGKNEIVEYLRS